MIQYIQETYGLPSVKGNAIKLHEDNIACIAQIKGESIKGDKTKHILRYICEISDMGLYYSKESKSQLIGYANTGYLSCTHKAQSQTGYVFT